MFTTPITPPIMPMRRSPDLVTSFVHPSNDGTKTKHRSSADARFGGKLIAIDQMMMTIQREGSLNNISTNSSNIISDVNTISIQKDTSRDKLQSSLEGSSNSSRSNDEINNSCCNYNNNSQQQLPDNVVSLPKPSSFPMMLHSTIDRIDKDGYSDIISWQPHGRCFMIHKMDEFKDVILPTYFYPLTKITKFLHYLNMYGFIQLSKGKDKGGYYNELFLREKPHLAKHIHQRMHHHHHEDHDHLKNTHAHYGAVSHPHHHRQPPCHPSPTKEHSLSPSPWERSCWDNAKPRYNPISFSSGSRTSSSTSISTLGTSTSNIVGSNVKTNDIGEPRYMNNSRSSSPSVSSLDTTENENGRATLFETGRDQQEPQPSCADADTNVDDDDIVVSFGGKHFHYMDPFQMLDGEKRPRNDQLKKIDEDEDGGGSGGNNDGNDSTNSGKVNNNEKSSKAMTASTRDDPFPLEDKVCGNDSAFLGLFQGVNI